MLKTSGHNKPWWRGGIFYQIYPRSFQDSSGNGVGDLNGITSRLEYVAGLGVDAIWISPFFKSPMKDFGYDVSDYRAVDPLFGKLEDFDSLLSHAHKLGLKVMIDQVCSHTSDQHPWFNASRQSHSNDKADWYVWADAKPDGSPPNNWLSVFGGPAWTWDSRRGQYYLHNFLKEQPDLNFHNIEVQAAILDIARFWLDRGVDGFRLDVCNFYFQNKQLHDNPVRGDGKRGPNPHDWQAHVHCRSQPENIEFIAKLRTLVDSYPDRCLMGEIADDQGLDRLIEYTDDQSRPLLHTAYCFEFLLNDCDPAFLHNVLQHWIQSGRGYPTWALGNHDFIRVASRWYQQDSRPEKLRLFAAFQLCLGGAICLYQGEELGLEQAEIPYEHIQDPEGIAFWPQKRGRDGCRTPMPWSAEGNSGGFSQAENTWLPQPVSHRQYAVDQQQNAPDSLLWFYKDMIKLRNAHSALRYGSMALLPAHDQILGFQRHADDEEFLCLFNFSTQPAKPSIQCAGFEPLRDFNCRKSGNDTMIFEPWGWSIMVKPRNN